MGGAGIGIVYTILINIMFSSYPKEAKQLWNGCWLRVDEIKHKSSNDKEKWISALKFKFFLDYLGSTGRVEFRLTERPDADKFGTW